MTNLLIILNNFYPAVSYRRVQKKKAMNVYELYTIIIWSLVMVRSQLPAQVVEKVVGAGIPGKSVACLCLSPPFVPFA